MSPRLLLGTTCLNNMHWLAMWECYDCCATRGVNIKGSTLDLLAAGGGEAGKEVG